MSFSPVLLCVAVVLAQAPQKDIEEKGKVSVGVHKVKMNEGTVYHIRVEGDGFRPEISIRPGKISPVGAGPERDVAELLFCPIKTDDYRILVGANAIQDDLEASNDYTFKVTATRIEKKPLLKEKKELTDDDPKYANRELLRKIDSHYKTFPIKLKAKSYYVIDMIRDGNDEQFDPILFLEDADGKIVAADDDSGGDLNARIVFQAKRSGEYRIIATTLNPAVGPFTLTVRTQTKE
jgi:hypothetical protein